MSWLWIDHSGFWNDWFFGLEFGIGVNAVNNDGSGNEDNKAEAAGVDGFGKDMVSVAPIDESVE